MALIDDMHARVNEVYADRKGVPGLTIRSDQVMALMEVLVELVGDLIERVDGLSDEVTQLQAEVAGIQAEAVFFTEAE